MQLNLVLAILYETMLMITFTFFMMVVFMLYRFGIAWVGKCFLIRQGDASRLFTHDDVWCLGKYYYSFAI